MTVLVLAPERDPTADRMVRELGRREVPVVRLDTAWFPDTVRLDADLASAAWDGTLRVRDRVVRLGDVRSVWYRSSSAFGLPSSLTPVERQWASTEGKLGLGGVLGSLPVLWVNHPARVADAAVKPAQLVAAVRCGLAVPHTLITNDAEAVRRFARGGAVVNKALGAPSVVEAARRATVFTHLLGEADLADLRGVEITTHQFQRWVSKAHEARVVVVGERIFTAGIHAGSAETRVDWRAAYCDLAYSRPALPDDVRHGLVRYCREFGLAYGAFDLVVTPDGGWVFLECNANGQYGWIEDAIGAPITAAIADLLMAGRTP
ncbi:ATP-grasp ribosomal peptide maturase [Pseudonocardia aurantiaca]|uniref:ATP-grasp ribosomal peptide maturase n=1 Tax=Pseudonocardia aurantiaca TaxID=75290 RepID=A0ABW4FNL5_9PSEU